MRILSNLTTGAKYYVYADTPASNGFSWTGGEENPLIVSAFALTQDGYMVEARLPYSLFGLDEKPENVEIAVFTKFINGPAGYVSTRFFGYEGNSYSRDQSLYLNFDETGFAPNKVFMLDEANNAIDTIDLIRGSKIVNDKYEASVKLTVTRGNLTITDATFGEYEQYVDKTQAGSGIYKFAIPTSYFENADSIFIPVASTSYGLNAQIQVNCNELSRFYLQSNGTANEINVWPSDMVKINGIENYVVSIEIYGDSSYLIPIFGTSVTITFTSQEIGGITSNYNGTNVYTVYVPTSELKVGSTYSIVAMYGRTITGQIRITAKALSSEEEDTLLNNAQLFLGFENGSIDNAVANQPDATMRRGEVQITDGIYTMNQSQRAMQVSGINLSNEFTVSVLINGADVKKTHGAHYANVLLSTGNVDGKKGYFTDETTPFLIAMRSDKIYIKAGVKADQIVLSDALSYVSNGFERWTFTVKRTSLNATTDTLEAKMYINGTLVSQGSLLIEKEHSLNNVDGVIGIGAPATYDDTTESNYVQGGTTDTVQKHDIRIDNFLLYNGIMTETMMQSIDGYWNLFA